MKGRLIVLIALVVFGICLGGTRSVAVAQPPVLNAPQGASTTVLNMFGTPFSCVSNGMPVVYTFDYTLPDVAVTQFGTATSPTVTLVNPTDLMAFANVEPQVALFVLAHECGHAYMLSTVELDADCWAATEGVKQGWFSSADLPAMWSTLQNNPGDWSHPPGIVRWKHDVDCVTNAEAGTPLIAVP